MKKANSREYFDWLVTNKAEVIEERKATRKYTDAVTFNVTKQGAAAKETPRSSGIIHRTIIGNTYNWMDSHDDVHLSGCFAKSINERGTSRIWHLHDHDFKIVARVGKPTKIYESAIAWADLGIDKAGDTEALHMDTSIMKSMNEQIFESYSDGEITQHSVGMQYVKLQLAINDAEYKDEYAVWQKYINLLGNPEKAVKEGMFWAIQEAKLFEISAVLEGSNELTPTLESKEPLQSTQGKSEPFIISLNKLINK